MGPGTTGARAVRALVKRGRTSAATLPRRPGPTPTATAACSPGRRAVASAARTAPAPPSPRAGASALRCGGGRRVHRPPVRITSAPGQPPRARSDGNRSSRAQAGAPTGLGHACAARAWARCPRRATGRRWPGIRSRTAREPHGRWTRISGRLPDGAQVEAEGVDVRREARSRGGMASVSARHGFALWPRCSQQFRAVAHSVLPHGGDEKRPPTWAVGGRSGSPVGARGLEPPTTRL